MISGGGERLVPEFEECRRLAGEKNLPLVEVYRRIEAGTVRFRENFRISVMKRIFRGLPLPQEPA